MVFLSEIMMWKIRIHSSELVAGTRYLIKDWKQNRKILSYCMWIIYITNFMVKAPAGSQDIVNFVSCLYIKLRFFKNHELYWSDLPQNSNLGRESFDYKSGVQIPVGKGQIFSHFSFFPYLFHFVHKKLNVKT